MCFATLLQVLQKLGLDLSGATDGTLRFEASYPEKSFFFSQWWFHIVNVPGATDGTLRFEACVLNSPRYSEFYIVNVLGHWLLRFFCCCQALRKCSFLWPWDFFFEIFFCGRPCSAACPRCCGAVVRNRWRWPLSSNTWYYFTALLPRLCHLDFTALLSSVALTTLVKYMVQIHGTTLLLSSNTWYSFTALLLYCRLSCLLLGVCLFAADNVSSVFSVCP
jgi:hypothetical protein